MVYLAPLIGAAALLSNFALAVPRPNPGSSKSSESSSSNDNGNYNSGSGYNGNSNSYNGNSNGNSNYNSNSYGSNNNYGSNGNYGSNSNYGSGSSYGGNYNSPSYGSGSSNYNNYGGGYDDCVSQCIAQYGNNAYQYNPTPTSSGSSDSSSSNYGSSSSSDSSSSSNSSSNSTSSSSESSSSGSGGDSGSIGSNGVTHTVIVAPSQGVFRYIPFALNASVGDTIEFRWGANGHTVTHSSELTPCNKTEENPFASGLQNAGFVYHQAVNTTNTTFFYCGAPTHCQKGMFGIINPSSNLDAPTSVSGMMQSLIAQDDDLRTLANATAAKVGEDGPAAKWGGNIDIAKLDPQFQSLAVSNVLYTRNVLAMNADGIWKNGSINLSGVGANTTTLMLPVDLGNALKQADATAPAPNTSASASPSVVGATTNASASGPAPTHTSGAESLVSSRLVVALIAVVATFLTL